MAIPEESHIFHFNFVCISQILNFASVLHPKTLNAPPHCNLSHVERTVTLL